MISWKEVFEAALKEWSESFSSDPVSFEKRKKRKLLHFASIGQRLALEGYSPQKLIQEIEHFLSKLLQKEGFFRSFPFQKRQWRDFIEYFLPLGIAVGRGYGEGLALRLHSMARFDPLTGLYNRHAFEKRFLYFLDYAKLRGASLVLAILNVDGMKSVNDVYGYPVGDLVLRGIASLIEEMEAEVVGRLSGDEFGLVFVQREETVLRKMELLLKSIQELEFLPEEDLWVTASCGVASFPRHGESWSDLMAAADSGLILAKMRGGNRVEVIVPGTGSASRVREIHEGAVLIRKALQDPKSIVPAFQPIWDTGKDEVVAYEVLARVDVGSRLVPASVFISAAEKEKIIERVDSIIFEKAFRVKKEYFPPGTLLFLNISVGELERGKIVKEIAGLLEKLDVPPSEVVFEVTEREAIRDIETLRESILSLESLGIRFALDDFGSGFSSFSYLQLFNFAYVKIDGALIRRIKCDERTRLIVKAMADLAREIEAEPIAEFVEDADTANQLSKLGVSFIQGYFVGKPEVRPGFVPK